MRVERLRQADLSRSLDHLDVTGYDGSSAFLGYTISVAGYPTTAGVAYAVAPTEIDGAEYEGAAAVFVADSANPRFAVNLGTTVPPIGSFVIVHSVGGRYVFRYDA